MKSRAPHHPALRVAIIGAGLMGHWHGRVARRLGAEVVAIVDPNPERAQALARELGTRSTATDAFDFLRTNGVDAMHICSPLSTHAALAHCSIECGIHALIEKPLAESAEETRALLNLARRKGVTLCPVHQVAFQDDVATAMHALADLGELFAIETRVCSAGGAGHKDSDLDEIVGEILPHPLSVLRKLWPNAAWEPELWFVNRSRAGELLVSGEYAGALLSMLISMHARPTCFEMTLHGERGAIQLDFFHGFAISHNGRVSRLRKIVRPFSAAAKLFGTASANLFSRAIRRETAYPGLRRLIHTFYAAVADDGPSPISAEEAIAVAVARDVILAAALSRPRDVTT